MENNLVAVYGSLREGHGNHRLLVDSEFVQKGTVDGFGMYTLGGFPACTPKGPHVPIVVEVYNVDELTMRRLDMLEGYPTFYNRKQVKVVANSGETSIAWMYFIDDEYPERMFVESGDWSKYHGGM